MTETPNAPQPQAAPGHGSKTGPLVRLLRRAHPLRRLPIWARYGITTGFVLASFAAGHALEVFYPYPFLIFLPGIILASFVFDRGSGFFATLLSAALAAYFFLEPRGALVPADAGQVISIALFTAIGLFTALVIEALRTTVEDLVIANEELGRSRREVAQNLGILEALIEGAPDPIYIKDREGRFVRVNAAFARRVGAPVGAIIGRTDRDILPEEDAAKLEAVDHAVMESRRPRVVEELIESAGLGARWFLSSRAPWYGPDGTLAGVIGFAHDIHERKLAEQEIRAAEAQKDVLLRDLNHRVKNHLQSVMSMLAMGRRQVTDEKARAAIQATLDRLAVLARVYDRLQLRKTGEPVVGAQDFIGGLCRELQATLADRPIALTLDLDDVQLEIGRAVSVGLIINEALTNALKYAFPGDMAGTVAVRFAREDEGLALEVRDNGVGIPREGMGDGTGRKLIRALAQQLGGTVDWRGPPGTTVAARFPDTP